MGKGRFHFFSRLSNYKKSLFIIFVKSLKGQKQFEFCESKLVHVAKILAGIGSGRDVFEHAQPGVSRPPDYVIDQEFLNPFAKLPQRHSIQSQLSIPHQAPSKVFENFQMNC